MIDVVLAGDNAIVVGALAAGPAADLAPQGSSASASSPR